MIQSPNRLGKAFKAASIKKLESVSKECGALLNELYNPLDATNRFINLALQDVEENSQSRQFLLESKEGLRKTSRLIRKLDECAKMLEKEIREISGLNESNKYPITEQR